jgi:hypothetical protein
LRTKINLRVDLKKTTNQREAISPQGEMAFSFVLEVEKAWPIGAVGPKTDFLDRMIRLRKSNSGGTRQDLQDIQED